MARRLKRYTVTAVKLNLELYKRLYLARRAEEYIIRYYSEDDMKTPMHMSMGQEHIPVGVCSAIGLRCQTFATYRSHATYIAMTGETDGFFAELYGKETGVSKGKAGSMHLSAPEYGFMGSSAVVASLIPVAVGAAFANKVRKTGKLVAVFFGDGATDEGVFWESINAASLYKLPIIFVLEDNDFAVHMRGKFRRGYKSINDIVGSFNCNIFKEETTDVEKIYNLTKKTMDAVEKSGKPAFLYLKCYRYLEHVGVNKDFDAGYRSESEFNQWYKKDCVAIQRSKLLQNRFTESEVANIESGIDRQIQKSVEKAKKASFCSKDELCKGLL